LEAGGKGTWRSFTSDYTYEFFNPLAAEYQNDTFRSNQLSFFQAIYAAYTQLTYRRKPWQVTTGVRYELTVNEMVSGSSTFDQRYDNWVPNFSVGYQLDKGRMIRLNYGFRIQRPFYQELNPFTNASDPRNQSKGNPDLLPELTHNIELGFPPFITAFARFTDQIITSYTIVIDSGVTLTMPVNAGKREDYGFSLFFQQRFFKQKLAVMISGDVFWSRIQGLFQSNEGWQSVLRSLITYTPSPRLVFEAMASFNSNQITLQGYQPVFNMYQFSVLYYLDKSRKLGVRAFVMNPFTPYYEFRSKVRGNGFYQEQVNGVAFRQFGIGIRYQFSELNPRPRRGGGAGSEAMEVY
jgi:outer membrane receptor protein involved in Fe transport